MKRIVLCFDGTWNTPADEALPIADQIETNVSRFRRSVQPAGQNGVAQIVWYNPGVGTRGWDHWLGGAFGAGLDEHILAGYRGLVDVYEDGDEVFVLGFSRGAYTARSLVGMIRNCGLVRPSFADWHIGVAYGIYRTREDGPDSTAAQAFRTTFGRDIVIRFLGVWDTVGALGIPGHLADRLNLAFYRFHDTRLSKIVKNAFQGIALDEHRQDYDICLWDPEDPATQTLEQRWFVGAHSDVGGGYSDRRLSDVPLRWMQDRAAGLGLGLDLSPASADNYRGPVTDTYATFLDGVYAKTRPPYYRRVLSTRFGNEVLDPSIDLRRQAADLAYEPPNPGLPPPRT